MKKQEIATNIILFLVLFLQPFFLKADESSGRFEQYRPYSRDSIFSLHVIDKNTYWGVGNSGLILKTTDGGKTWLKMDTPLSGDYALNGVTFVGDNGWIVGDRGLILYTRDGGNRWVKQESHSEFSLMQVFFMDEKRGIAVGEQGTVLRTEDGGSLWQVVPFEWSQLVPMILQERGVLAPNLSSVFFLADGAHGWIAGEGGMIVYTGDGGKNWRLLRSGNFPPLYSIYFKDSLEGWTVGHKGFIAHSEDGGMTWNEQKSSVKTSLYKVRFSGNRGVAVGDLGTILQTMNGGVRWEVVNPGLRPPLPFFLDIAFPSGEVAGEAILAGRGFLNINFDSLRDKK